MEKVTNELEAAVSKLISEKILEMKQKGCINGYADDVRIKYGVPEDVLCIGYFDTLYREIMMYPQIKKLFASIGIHLCLYEDQGEGNGALFYLFIDPKGGKVETACKSD